MGRDRTKYAQVVASDLIQILRALMHRLRAESVNHELNQAEQGVLRRLLDDGPCTTAALSRSEWVKPQSMGATVASLEDKGLVARTIDALDGRRRPISITDQGKRLLQEGRAARQNWLAQRIEENLDAEEQRALQSALDLLRDVVES